MLHRHEEEKNFIEKKREWKGELDKPLKRSTLIVMLPALIIGVFLVMSVPYIKIIMEKVLGEDVTLDLKSLNLKDAPKSVEKPLPPPNPDQKMAEFYRDLYDREGFDWRSIPVAPEQDMEFAQEQPIELAPIEVEILLAQPELQQVPK